MTRYCFQKSKKQNKTEQKQKQKQTTLLNVPWTARFSAGKGVGKPCWGYLFLKLWLYFKQNYFAPWKA